ncbi:MAG TPA: hypothetical protein VLF42_09710 [Burkholderiales bacterium]|nr:hypothetical protein [Burkholderiales bacterium]
MPSALALRRLKTSSKRLACSTGVVAGCAPVRMRCAIWALRSCASAMCAP